MGNKNPEEKQVIPAERGTFYLPLGTKGARTLGYTSNVSSFFAKLIIHDSNINSLRFGSFPEISVKSHWKNKDIASYIQITLSARGRASYTATFPVVVVAQAMRDIEKVDKHSQAPRLYEIFRVVQSQVSELG